MSRSRTIGPCRIGGFLAAGMVLFTGCGLLDSEQTARTEPTPSPPPTTAPGSSAPPPPSRPTEVPLTGKNPCDLLTIDQRAQLGFDREPTPGLDEGFADAATCSYRNTTAKTGARLALIDTEGIGVWTSDTAQVDAKRTTIHDFPALTIKTPGLEESCNVAVDVAEGQHLDVLYRDDGGEPAPPVDDLCVGAQHVAAEVVRTLPDDELRSP